MTTIPADRGRDQEAETQQQPDQRLDAALRRSAALRLEAAELIRQTMQTHAADGPSSR